VNAQASFDDYRQERVQVARDHGLHAVRVADPDAFEAALREIRAVTSFGWTFTADDVRQRLVAPGNELGAGFAHLRRLGEIEACGFETSKHAAGHGHLVRRWRGTS
jgi:hypothetical protein